MEGSTQTGVGTGSEMEVQVSRLPFLAGSDGLDLESQHVTGRGRAAQVISGYSKSEASLGYIRPCLRNRLLCYSTVTFPT